MTLRCKGGSSWCSHVSKICKILKPDTPHTRPIFPRPEARGWSPSSRPANQGSNRCRPEEEGRVQQKRGGCFHPNRFVHLLPLALMQNWSKIYQKEDKQLYKAKMRNQLWKVVSLFLLSHSLGTEKKNKRTRTQVRMITSKAQLMSVRWYQLFVSWYLISPHES